MILPERKCAECKKVFTSRYSLTYLEKHPTFERFCSSNCRSLALRKPLVRMECVICSKIKMVQRSELKWRKVQYCSKKCGGKGYSANFSGENHPFYKGDRAMNRKFRTDSQPYRKWRRAVLERDNHVCTWCKSTESLEVDHIKPKSLFPELVFDTKNGRTLCHDCHTKTPTYSRTLTKEQYEML